MFYGEERHLTYWKNHILPVYIILHNPEKNLTLRQKVSDHLISYHDEGRWSMEIPPDQILNEKAGKFMKQGISSDEASIRRFRMALDLPLIQEIESRSSKESIFLTLDEWINKTLNFREGKLRFDSPNADPEYELTCWLPRSNVNEVMAHYFPWLDYKYAFEIEEDGSGEVEGHVLEVGINDIGKAYLKIESYYRDGAEIGTLEPWYERSNESIAERFGDEDYYDQMAD